MSVKASYQRSLTRSCLKVWQPSFWLLQRVAIAVVWRGGDGVERKGKSALEQDEELSGGDGGGGVGGDCT